MMTNTQKNGDSRVYQSSHVQMTAIADTQLWAGISRSTEMEKLLAALNVTHIEYSEVIQQRLQGLSKQVQGVLELIIADTSDEHNRLLNYAQEIQARDEALQRDWLHKYLIVLDQWRATELARLHERVEEYKKQINSTEKDKLTRLNQQVKLAQTNILKEEQEKHAAEATRLVGEMDDLALENKGSTFWDGSYN